MKQETYHLFENYMLKCMGDKMNVIFYRNYNREFGARQEDKMYYPNGYLDFFMFTRSRMFIEGINSAF